MTIKTKRVYDKPEPSDGYRVLIMRSPMWINKSFKEFHFDKERWRIELSPSHKLLQSWHDKKISWETFELRFMKEIIDNPDALRTIYNLYEKSKEMDITLLCQEKEGEHCHRHLVKKMIDEGSKTDKGLFGFKL